MITVRPANEHGRSNFGWLDSRHTFSFGRYHDPEHMGFRALRVINEDRVKPGAGFGTHPHKNMEILSYVLEGAIEHKDSMGNGSVIRPGELQRISAGTGLTHSEFNHSKTEPLHFLQIWILPEKDGLEPEYEQKAFPLVEHRGRLVLLASRNADNDSVTVHQDVFLYGSSLSPGDTVTHRLQPGRHAWVQVVRGKVSVNGSNLQDADGASVSDEETLEITAQNDAEVLVFDLA